MRLLWTPQSSGSWGGLAQEVHSGRGPNRQCHDLRRLRRAAHRIRAVADVTTRNACSWRV